MKKGFTIMELLAVIVIVAIITLIATPKITNIVENAKKNTAENSALGYIDAIEKQAAINQLNSDSSDDITKGIYSVDELLSKKVLVKGKRPSSGTVEIDEKIKVVDYSLQIGNYTVTPKDGNPDKPTAKKNGFGNEPELKAPPIQTNFTKIDAKETDTHKGIVYLDPTNLTQVCTKAQVDANVNEYRTPTEIKTGCMKFYIFDDSGDTYKMILDHNVVAKIEWNANNVNVAYESSSVKPYVDALVTTSKWKVTPRLITIEEVNKITGKTSFDIFDKNSWYYLDRANMGSDFHIKYTSETVKSSYAWLFDYLNSSVQYGADYNDNNTYSLASDTSVVGGTYGYWTSNTVGESESGNRVWYIGRFSYLDNGSSSSQDRGIRPVIEITKSSING